jgi:predicted transcriptional regulator
MLEHLFGSRTRVKLMRLFLSNPDKAFFVRELTRKIKERINSVRRELNNLEKIGVVQKKNDQRKVFYQADKDHVLYRELRALVLKAEVGLERSLAKTLKDIGNVRLMVLTGMFTGMKEETQTDMLIVGQANRRKLTKLMKKFQDDFGRQINYTVMSTKEYKYRRDLTDRFLFNILENPNVVLIDKINKE